MSTHTEIPSALDKFLNISRRFQSAIQRDPLTRENFDDSIVADKRAKVRACLTCNAGGWSSTGLFRIRKTVEIKFHLREATQEQWLIIREIEECLAGNALCISLRDESAWKAAIQHAVDSINANWFRHSMMGNSRELVVANAVKKARRLGFRIPISGYGPKLPGSEYRRFCKRIEKSVIRLGGEELTGYILVALRRTGKILDGYISHARRPEQISRSKREAGTPWHFLYSLSLKHLDKIAIVKFSDAQKEFENLLELSQILTAIIDCEPHSAYENMSLSDVLFAQTLNETLIYDEMFAFPQWHPKIAAHLFNLWISALIGADIKLPVASASKWKEFGAMLLARADSAHAKELHPFDLITTALDSSERNKLLDICALPHSKTNTKLFTPSDTEHRNSCYYPVIHLSTTRHIVQPKGIAGRALWERLYTAMRESHIPQLEDKLGLALELLTEAILAESGQNITFKREKYKNPKGKGKLEVDLVVETQERIFFIECKKKVLTNESRRGDTIASFTDIDKSFLALVQQLARHEANLREGCEIEFESGRKLLLDGRKIEKIGISLFDHGSIQNRDMTIALLELLVGRNIGFDDAAFQKLTASVNRKLNGISESLKSIEDQSSASGHSTVFDFAMSTWWLSIDHMAYAMELAHGDLWNGLKNVRHMTTRSGDFLYDLHVSHNLNQVAEAILDVSSKTNARAMV
jgi:hypothetical protein